MSTWLRVLIWGTVGLVLELSLFLAGAFAWFEYLWQTKGS